MIAIPKGFWDYLVRHRQNVIQTYGIIADWCADHDDELQAKAWRWLEKKKKQPIRTFLCFFDEIEHRCWTWEFSLPRKLFKRSSIVYSNRFRTHRQAIQFVINRLIETKTVKL